MDDETHSDLDDFISCSPVLEAWVRWDPEIRCSGRIILSSFSNDKDALRLLAAYMRGHRIMVTAEVLPELLSVADILQVDDVTNYCKHRIQIQPLSKDNCLQILKACTLYDIEHPEVEKFIRANIIELAQRQDMLAITPNTLEILLTDEELSYWPMDDRFVFITDWCSTRDDRALDFETLFEYLDLTKIDRDIIEVIVKNNKFVRGSKACIDRVNMHLYDKQDKPIPFVFIMNDFRTGSNVLGFNLEDKQLYKFNFPDEMINSTHVTVAESGHILSTKKLLRKMYVYDYDINSNICKKKVLQSKESLPDNLLHILDANGRLILIFDKRREYLPFKRGKERGSILYQQVSDDGNTIQIEPLLTFTFDVSCACFSESMIIVSSTTYVKRSKLMCFNLQTNKITETDIGILHIQCILSFPGKLFVGSNSNYCQILELDEESKKYNIKTDSPSHRYMWDDVSRCVHFSDFIIGIKQRTIHLCDTSSGEIDMTKTKSYDLKQLRFDGQKSLVYGYLDRMRPLCHIMCPHCDPNAKEEEQRLEELEQRNYRHAPYFRNDDLYFEDHDYCDYDYNDDYYDDDWDRKELIWDGSADEFVEAWW